MNKVVLLGRLTKDVELRYTENNVAVASFNLAVNRPRREDGKQEADFINIVVWGKQAEICSKYLKKGSKLAIDGRIQTRNYEQDGRKVYVTEVVAENIQFLDTKKDGQATNTQSIETQPTNEYAQMSTRTEVQQQFEYSDEDLPF